MASVAVAHGKSQRLQEPVANSPAGTWRLLCLKGVPRAVFGEDYGNPSSSPLSCRRREKWVYSPLAVPFPHSHRYLAGRSTTAVPFLNFCPGAGPIWGTRRFLF